MAEQVSFEAVQITRFGVNPRVSGPKISGRFRNVIDALTHNRRVQAAVSSKETAAAMVFEQAAVAGAKGLQRKRKQDVPCV